MANFLMSYVNRRLHQRGPNWRREFEWQRFGPIEWGGDVRLSIKNNAIARNWRKCGKDLNVLRNFNGCYLSIFGKKAISNFKNLQFIKF